MLSATIPATSNAAGGGAPPPDCASAPERAPLKPPGEPLLGEHDLLALVGLPVGRFGGVRVGEVLGRHVHAHALAPSGRVPAIDDRVEEAHQRIPIAERMMPLRVPTTSVSAW